MPPHEARRILVVEDDQDYRRAVERILQAAGFVVTAAADFAGAISLIESGERFDVLLTDIGMPAGTPHGFSIGAVARRLQPDLRVVFMTGGQNPSEFSLFAVEARVLKKPFTRDQLTAAIAAALGR